MKKIPTLFEREFDDRGKLKRVLETPKTGFEWVFDGEGVATEKVDGVCCAIIGGKFYKRFDAKEGRKIPDGAIPCMPMRDPYTGNWPHWLPVDFERGGDKWFVAAYKNSPWITEDGTYEAVGPHFQNNPYGLDEDCLEKHGRIVIHDCPRTFEGIREYLRTHEIEGICFWRDGKPMCKIKRTDFGFKWPVPLED